MQKEKNALNALQNIEIWCRSIASANTVTAKCAGMLALLMEVEYAIEKYKSMAERFKLELPLNVTARDFEEWTDKLDEYRSTYFLEDIKYIDKDYFTNKGNDDWDIIRKFSGEGSEGMAGRILHIPVSILNTDERLFCDIAEYKNLNSWLSSYQSRKQLKEGIADLITAREAVLKLKIGYLIDEKIKLLSDVIDNILQQLTAPTKDALNGVYRHYEDEFSKAGGEKICERKVAEWVADHEDKANVLELFDKKIESLRQEINETFYGVMWDEFFDTSENDVQLIDKSIGRYIFRNLEKFNDNPDHIKQFFTHIYLWLHFNWEKMSTEENLENPDPNVISDEKTEVNGGIILPEIFKDTVRGNSARTEMFLSILQKNVIIKVLQKGGARDKNWRWPHVYYAFADPRLDFIDADTDKIAFGRAMHDIDNSLVDKNVARTFKDLNPCFPLVPDQSIISDIVNLFKPVKNQAK